jgi:hypothetical protein
MTATIAAFGLVPLLFATGPGSEIQKPLAIVVIGGLVSSTLLTLILPILYEKFGENRKKPPRWRWPMRKLSSSGPWRCLMHAGRAMAQSGEGRRGCQPKRCYRCPRCIPGRASRFGAGECGTRRGAGSRAGPHEFTLTTTYASRTVNDGTGVANGRFNEFSAEVRVPSACPARPRLIVRSASKA